MQTANDLINEKKFIAELAKHWPGSICKTGEYDHFDYTLVDYFEGQTIFVLELRARTKSMQYFAENNYMVSTHKINRVVEAAEMRNARPIFGVQASDGQFLINLEIEPNEIANMEVPDRNPVHGNYEMTIQSMNFYTPSRYLPLAWVTL